MKSKLRMSLSSSTLVLSLFLLTSTPLRANILVQSTFDAGSEGWEVGDFFDSTGSAAPVWLGAGGNPGGFIRTDDQFNWNAFQAPAAFLGDQSAAYGGNLHLEQRVLSSDGIMYPMVIISDGSLRLQFRTSPPTTGWTPYNISLLAAAGWEVDNDASGNPGPAATEAQLQQVLSSLVFLNVDADWLTGSDQIDLDNVRLESAGVPDAGSALGLLLIALGSLACVGSRAHSSGRE